MLRVSSKRFRTLLPHPDQRRRFVFLLGLVGIQALSASFFLGDVTADFMAIGWDPHTRVEATATLALILGVIAGGIEMWRLFHRQSQTESALRIVSGAFGDLIDERFETWALSASERQVALLTLKGFDTPEIAALRGTAQGTVRAQLGSIYTKSGTSGRGQLVSLFVEELLDFPLP